MHENRQSMAYRRLGTSGLLVSRFCLGAMVFGEMTGRGADERQSQAIIGDFLAAGGNFIDTADAYAEGESERIVGRAVAAIRDQVVISTKVGLPTGNGVNEAGLMRKHVLSSVEASLRRLNTDYVDVLFLRTHDPLTPAEEWLEVLDRLIASTKVLYAGVCNQFAWRLAQACALSQAWRLPRIVCVQYQYGPVCRYIEDEYFDLFENFGISLIPWSPLGGGVLSGKYRPMNEKLQFGRLDAAPSLEDSREKRLTDRNQMTLNVICDVARRLGATPAQVSLAWVLSKPCVASVALGVRTLEQLRENLAAGALQLSPVDLGLIDDVSKPARHYPYDFMRKERPGLRSLVVARGAEAT